MPPFVPRVSPPVSSGTTSTDITGDHEPTGGRSSTPPRSPAKLRLWAYSALGGPELNATIVIVGLLIISWAIYVR